MTKKINEFHIYNVLLCFFVVFIHISSEAVTKFSKDSYVYAIIFVLLKILSFVVPAFIFISGFKLSNKYNKTNFKYISFIKSRVLKIYIPYMAIATLYFIYFVYRGFQSFSFTALLNRLVLGSIASPFYFIVTIMQFYFLMPLWILLFKKINPHLILVLGLIITIISKYYLTQPLSNNSYSLVINFLKQYNDRFFLSYLIYWLMGFYLGKYYLETKNFLSKHSTAISFIYIILACIHILLSFKNSIGLYQYKYAEIIHIFFCFMSIIIFYLLSSKSKNAVDKFSSTLLFIDSISFDIYLWHCLFIYIIDERLYRYNIISISARFIIRFIFVYAATILLSTLLQNIKQYMAYRNVKSSKYTAYDEQYIDINQN